MLSAKLLEARALKEAELARCVVELAQANERLTAVQVSNLQEQLHLSHQECVQMKQRVVTLEQEKSDFLVDLSSLKEECAQLKSELSDVNKNCESSIAYRKQQETQRTPQGPVVQPVKQYVWKSSGDVCVSGFHGAELLKCPPMTSGVHTWAIFVEEDQRSRYAGLGVASTVHSLDKQNYLGNQEGGWSYYSDGQAFHNKQLAKPNFLFKDNFPKFQKGSKVTFVLDLTGHGTLSASLDGKSFDQLFLHMLSKVRSVDPEGGFVPAVTLPCADQKVRFLGFESVSE
jgi:hypothetical protein